MRRFVPDAISASLLFGLLSTIVVPALSLSVATERWSFLAVVGLPLCWLGTVAAAIYFQGRKALWLFAAAPIVCIWLIIGGLIIVAIFTANPNPPF